MFGADMGGRSGREFQRRPLFGTDLRIGAVLAIVLAFKFAPPMMSARIDKKTGPITPTLVDVGGKTRPSDALTNILPSTVSPAAAKDDEPPVLSAPVFELEERKPPSLPEPPKLASLGSKTSTAIDASSKKPQEIVPPKAPKLKAPDPLRDEPKKSPPIVFADAIKTFMDPLATETKKPTDTRGPVHPYFQRYLDQKEYFVRPGDTLEIIAHRLFQDEKKAVDLLALNKDALPTPDALKPGMTIKLP
jgi:nucleoid-associated protein YgaU